jgi:glycerol 3-phosphatase-2
MQSLPAYATTRDLLERYAGVLLDIYGVLLDRRGTLPGAVELVGALNGVPYALVTNDASRSVANYVLHLASLGLTVDPARLITSGSLMASYFAAKSLRGARVGVLGTTDSAEYVRKAGGVVVPIVPGVEFDVLAVCDVDDGEFLLRVEWALSAVIRGVKAGRPPILLLPNPDLVYPKSPGEFGLTAGAIALMIEAALAQRYSEARFVFDRLGKPEVHLFAEAARRLNLPPAQLLMIGDQLETDIVGALAAGCDAALLAGVSDRVTSTITPTWVITKLWP